MPKCSNNDANLSVTDYGDTIVQAVSQFKNVATQVQYYEMKRRGIICYTVICFLIALLLLINNDTKGHVKVLFYA